MRHRFIGMLDNDGGPTELLGPRGVEARDAESGNGPFMELNGKPSP